MNLKILKILGGNDGGGVFQCEKKFIKYWKRGKVKIDAVVVGEGESSGDYHKLIDETVQLPDAKFNTSNSKYLGVINNFVERRKYVNRNLAILSSLGTYDVIIYRRNFFDYLAFTIANKNAAKIYWHIPISMRNIFEKGYYNYMLKINGITPIANSKYTRDSLGSICRDYVYPGFDESRIKTENIEKNLRKKLGIPDKSPVFGIAARIKKRKAQHLAIQSMIKVLESHTNTHLIIAGGPLDTEYAKYCLALSKEHENNIHFIGHLDDVATLYSSIDLYINSRLDAEPFGISVAEAMGASLPVVALKFGGPSEMIKENQNGWLIQEPTVTAYTETLINAIKNKDKWDEMGKVSRDLSEQFRAEKNAEKFLSIIKKDIAIQ